MSLPQSFFKRKMPAPSSEGAFDGQPQGLSLRHDIEFDLIATDNSYIFANFLGGSKPPPYCVGYIFSICAKYPLLFTFLCRKARPVPTVLGVKFTSLSFKRFCHKHGVFGRVEIKIFSKSYLRETAFSVKSDCVFVRLSHFKCYKLGIFFTADLFKML